MRKREFLWFLPLVMYSVQLTLISLAYSRVLEFGWNLSHTVLESALAEREQLKSGGS